MPATRTTTRAMINAISVVLNVGVLMICVLSLPAPTRISVTATAEQKQHQKNNQNGRHSFTSSRSCSADGGPKEKVMRKQGGSPRLPPVRCTSCCSSGKKWCHVHSPAYFFTTAGIWSDWPTRVLSPQTKRTESASSPSARTDRACARSPDLNRRIALSVIGVAGYRDPPKPKSRSCYVTFSPPIRGIN
jgi:hypothetical protein